MRRFQAVFRFLVVFVRLGSPVSSSKGFVAPYLRGGGLYPGARCPRRGFLGRPRRGVACAPSVGVFGRGPVWDSRRCLPLEKNAPDNQCSYSKYGNVRTRRDTEQSTAQYLSKAHWIVNYKVGHQVVKHSTGALVDLAPEALVHARYCQGLTRYRHEINAMSTRCRRMPTQTTVRMAQSRL